MKTYWLAINPDVFIWNNHNKGLIFNSANQAVIEYDNTYTTADITEQLGIMDNLYSIEINDSQLSDNDFREWVEKIVEYDCGTLTPTEQSLKPVSLMPVLRIRETAEKMVEKHEISWGGGSAITHLHELTIHLNGNTGYKDLFWKQSIHPSDYSDTLSFERIKNFIHECRGAKMSIINIVGDLSAYPEREELLDWLALQKNIKTKNIFVTDGIKFRIEADKDRQEEYGALLADKILQYIYNDELLRELGEAGRKRVLTHYGLEKFGNNMINFYNSLV